MLPLNVCPSCTALSKSSLLSLSSFFSTAFSPSHSDLVACAVPVYHLWRHYDVVVTSQFTWQLACNRFEFLLGILMWVQHGRAWPHENIGSVCKIFQWGQGLTFILEEVETFSNSHTLFWSFSQYLRMLCMNIAAMKCYPGNRLLFLIGYWID